MDKNIKRVPVFVFPNALQFYLASRETHKQFLTLYNPYDVPVQFKVMCTAPAKYAVVDPEGVIAPQSLLDVIVRHTAPSVANCNIPDKFRICMFDNHTKHVLGKRDIVAKLLAGEPEPLTKSDELDNFQSFSRGIKNEQLAVQYMQIQNKSYHDPNFVAIFVGLMCISALCLPTQQDSGGGTDSPIPTYMHISVQFKIIIAFVLGFVSMSVLRP